MSMLALGLLLFLGVHSVRIVAEDWRTAQVRRFGLNGWKAAVSIVSAVGLLLIVWGYGATRMEPIAVWAPPVWTRHLAALLTLPAFVLLAAAYVPKNRLRPAVGHPMVLGVKVWALAHLISNGRLGDIVLFGAFLLWSVFDFRAARRRQPSGASPAPGGVAGDIATIAVGVVAWWLFAAHLHRWLIGVQPFG